MAFKDKLKDNYITGVILAFVILPITYFGAEGIRSVVVKYKADPYLYPPPAAQLISLLFSIIVFRIVMINMQKEKIGKGYLFIVALAVFGYFFIFNKLRNN